MRHTISFVQMRLAALLPLLLIVPIVLRNERARLVRRHIVAAQQCMTRKLLATRACGRVLHDGQLHCTPHIIKDGQGALIKL